MIFNENGSIIESVVIDGNTFQFTALTESENALLDYANEIKDIIKECDDKKVKKLERNAKQAYLSQRIHKISNILKTVFGASTVISTIGLGKKGKLGPIGNAGSWTIIPVSFFALCVSFIGVSKLSKSFNSSTIDSMTRTINEAIESFGLMANNESLPDDVRDSAKEKMIKLNSMIKKIQSKKDITFMDQLKATDPRQCNIKISEKINSNDVYVDNKVDYELKSEEYKDICKIINSKFNKIMNLCIDYFNKEAKSFYDKDSNIDKNFISIYQNKINIYGDEKLYIVEMDVDIEYEEINDYVKVKIEINREDIKSKKGEITIRHNNFQDKKCDL